MRNGIVGAVAMAVLAGLATPASAAEIKLLTTGAMKEVVLERDNLSLLALAGAELLVQ